MVKKMRACDTADESDADVVREWLEEAPTRRAAPRGPYKTMKGVACKTEEEKGAGKAARQKKWKMA